MSIRKLTFLESNLLLIGLGMIAALVACSSSNNMTTPPTPAISVKLTPLPPVSLATSATANIAATVTNDSAKAGVSWTATCGGAGSCGSFSTATSLSGTTVTYTAPASVPSGNSVTITATSVTDPTRFASARVTVTRIVATTLAPGNYVFSLSGEGANGPNFVAGVFTVSKSGAITGGEQTSPTLASSMRMTTFRAAASSPKTTAIC